MRRHSSCQAALRHELIAIVAVLVLGPFAAADAQSPQPDDFEAQLAAAAARRQAPARDASAAPSRENTSRYFRRNHLTVEERRSDPTRAPQGLVPPEFRGKPATLQAFEAAKLAILRRKMDPQAYLVGATAGTVLPPAASLVACGGNSDHLFYTLGTEDPVLLHNLAARRSGLSTTTPLPTPKPGTQSPAAAIASAAAFLKAHGYRPVPTWLEPNLYAPVDERPGQASVRVSITADASLAMAACGYRGEPAPPSGPGLQVRVHFAA